MTQRAIDLIHSEAKALVRSRTLWAGRLARAENSIEMAYDAGLVLSPYFVELIAYWHRAKLLQSRNLGRLPGSVVSGDALQDSVPIYDTVNRRYAGFSNVLEQLYYGDDAPKIKKNRKAKRDYPNFRGSYCDWAYLCLVHRLTGSGASFEQDHGWRNTVVPWLASKPDALTLNDYVGPIFTSIGNQVPAFNKLKRPEEYRLAGIEYIMEVAPVLVKMTMDMLISATKFGARPFGVTQTVDAVCAFQRKLGHKQFKFVFTAWVMDLAEYAPKLVDPSSDCYHGKNAIEAINLCFSSRVLRGQKLYHAATRFVANITDTNPMDVEDVFCDFIRWVGNYVPKKGYEGLNVFNSSSLTYSRGRQP